MTDYVCYSPILHPGYAIITAFFCRFLALRELIPHKDKMDKATFLQQAVEYIRQLQVGFAGLLVQASGT